MTTFLNTDGNRVSLDERGAAETIHAYLFGGLSSELSLEDRVDVYLACDGFGDTSQPGPLREQIRDYMAGGWDWSHVRDSSAQGLYRALGLIVARQGRRS